MIEMLHNSWGGYVRQAFIKKVSKVTEQLIAQQKHEHFWGALEPRDCCDNCWAFLVDEEGSKQRRCQNCQSIIWESLWERSRIGFWELKNLAKGFLLHVCFLKYEFVRNYKGIITSFLFFFYSTFWYGSQSTCRNHMPRQVYIFFHSTSSFAGRQANWYFMSHINALRQYCILQWNQFASKSFG